MRNDARNWVVPWCAIVEWMDLVPIQRCESGFPWFTVEMESQSEPGVVHEVMVPLPTDDIGDFICDCRGFEYRGMCKHIEEVSENMCRWDSTLNAEQQTPDQERDMMCPRCGGRTVRTTEFV